MTSFLKSQKRGGKYDGSFKMGHGTACFLSFFIDFRRFLSIFVDFRFFERFSTFFIVFGILLEFLYEG